MEFEPMTRHLATAQLLCSCSPYASALALPGDSSYLTDGLGLATKPCTFFTLCAIIYRDTGYCGPFLQSQIFNLLKTEKDFFKKLFGNKFSPEQT